MRELRGSLRAGIFTAYGGFLVLFGIEAVSFLVSPRRRLFLSLGEGSLFFLCLLGTYALAALGVGILEGFACFAALKSGDALGRRRRGLDTSSLIYSVFFASLLWLYVILRNAVPAGLFLEGKRHLYLALLGFSTLCSAAALYPLYQVQSFRAAMVRPPGARSAGRRRGGVLVLAAVPCLLLLHYANTTFYVRLYPYVHNMMSVATFWFGALAAAGAVLCLLSRPPALRTGRSWALVGAASVIVPVLSLFAFIDSNQNVKRVLLLESMGGNKLTCVYQRLLDFDGDGYSAFLGGGDADDGDASVNPATYDVPGNGVDEDGRGGDRPPFASPPRRSPETPARDLDLVFVTVDAARPDHLGCYGYARDTTPNIDKLAGKAVRFENAYSASCTTIYSMNAMMSSRSPSSVEQGERPETLAGVLGKSGFVTGVVGPRIRFEVYGSRFIFYDGFGIRDLDLRPATRLEDLISPRLTERALRFVEENRDRRFFLWLHYYDPHTPYLTNEETSAWGGRLVDLYDGELRRSDACFGDFMDGLRKLGLLSDTAIVVFGDHGEEFREHGGLTHATTVYDEQLRVPLLIYAPGVDPRVVGETVSLMDVAPTALALLGVEAPAGMRGRSLLPLMLGEEGRWEGGPVFAETPKFRKRAVVEDGWKLIYDYRYNTFELYDLSADPGETRNLFDRERERASALQQTLFALY